MNKIWNGKIKGLLGAFCIAISIAIDKMADKIATFLFSKNISSCGKNVRVMRGVFYRDPKHIICGEGVIIGYNTSFTSEYLGDYILKIDNNVSIGNNCSIDFSGGVMVMSSAHIAHNVQIITHDHKYDYRNKPIAKPLIIGDNAFIGSRSIILHNCNNIGKNSVIGTGSVVTTDVPDKAIVAGNPARIIKFIE